MDNKELQVVKDNVIQKVINFIKNMFYKKDTQILNADINVNSKNEKNLFIDEIKIENEENSDIIKLQKQVENSEISLEALSTEEITALELLYDRQITNLNKKLEERQLEYNLLIKELNIA